MIGPLATATYDLNGTWSGLGTGAGTTPPVTVLDGIKAAAADPSAVSFAQGCEIESDDTSGFAGRSRGGRCRGCGRARPRRERGDERRGVGPQQHRSARCAGGSARGCGCRRKASRRRAFQRAATDPAVHARHARPRSWRRGLPGSRAGTPWPTCFSARSIPAGNLPVSFPRAVGQVPIYYNHLNTGRPADPANKYTSKYLDLPSGPLYSFGFGLSYTTFTISAPRLEFDNDEAARRPDPGQRGRRRTPARWPATRSCSSTCTTRSPASRSRCAGCAGSVG